MQSFKTVLRVKGAVTQTQRFNIRNFHKDFNTERANQTLQLLDGRKLGFAEYGNLQGAPAIFLHGSPGSRYDGTWLSDIAKKLDVRLICPDRPGYGLSTFIPDQKLSEYPNDIAQLVKHLQLPKYHVFGISGGGPYAVACAYKLPRDQLLTAAVWAGMGHPDATALTTKTWRDSMVFFLMKWTPSLLRYAINRARSDDKQLEWSLKRDLQNMTTAEDWAIISEPSNWSQVVAGIKAAYASGPEGAIRDGQIYIGPWDFQLKDVDKEVKLFFGRKDDRTPPEYGRHYKQHLPHAELIEFDDMSHFTTHRDEEILARIVGVWKPSDAGGTKV